MVYPAGEGIAQVVYWGDMPGYSELRAMNLLAEYVYEYYRRAGMRLLDLGPATETVSPTMASVCSRRASAQSRHSSTP